MLVYQTITGFWGRIKAFEPLQQRARKATGGFSSSDSFRAYRDDKGTHGSQSIGILPRQLTLCKQP
jgi:hypothetical protein